MATKLKHLQINKTYWVKSHIRSFLVILRASLSKGSLREAWTTVRTPLKAKSRTQ